MLVNRGESDDRIDRKKNVLYHHVQMTIEAFEWDEGNKEKNLIKHKVTMEECEQVFQNSVYLIIEDLTHSQDEERFKYELFS